MRPIVDGLEAEYGARMTFRRLNAAQEGQDLFQQYNLRGHPSYVILDDQGTIVWRLVGQVPRETLEQAIRQSLEEDQQRAFLIGIDHTESSARCRGAARASSEDPCRRR